ncbi:hypothetical protein [Demequina litorisediminis]|uniref:hypothetical protein n=1 Tax=Demequina litorisediminis TaxID=1849022 RepID=UPI0024E12347|nr:hypothetical protein [Demequina litorisediminis]
MAEPARPRRAVASAASASSARLLAAARLGLGRRGVLLRDEVVLLGARGGNLGGGEGFLQARNGGIQARRRTMRHRTLRPGRRRSRPRPGSHRRPRYRQRSGQTR